MYANGSDMAPCMQAIAGQSLSGKGFLFSSSRLLPSPPPPLGWSGWSKMEVPKIANSTRQNRFEATQVENRFDELNKQRAAQRAAWEAEITRKPREFVGTCQEMCSEYERHEREAHLDVSPFEALTGATSNTGQMRINHSRAVKKYHRPAAGNEAPLPEDIRPPPVLRKTLDYLLDEILDDNMTIVSSRQSFPFSDKHKFVRDRTRSIRQDIIVQQRAIEANPEWLAMAVEMHEMIARFHILSGHRLCESDFSEFDPFQNTEQLRKVLQSLQEYYIDIRRLLVTPSSTINASATVLVGALNNEPEFRAYQLLTHAEDQDVFRQALAFAPEVFSSSTVQFALRCVSAFHQADYVKYFQLTTQADYLQACLLHTHFSKLRRKAIIIMGKAFNIKEPISAIDLARWLSIEGPDELSDLLETYGGSLDATNMSICLAANASDDMPIVKARQSKFIESKAASFAVSTMVRRSSQLPSSASITRPAPLQVANTLMPAKLKIIQKPDMTVLKSQIASTMTSNLLDLVKICEINRICREAIVLERSRRVNVKAHTVARVAQLTFSNLFREIYFEACTDYLNERRRVSQASRYKTTVVDILKQSLASKIIREVVRRESKLICRKAIEPPPSCLIVHSVPDESFSALESGFTTPRSKIRRIRTSDLFLTTPLRTLDQLIFDREALPSRVQSLASETLAELLESKKLEELIQNAINL